MIHIFKYITNLETILNKLVSENQIVDFRLKLNVNNKLQSYIQVLKFEQIEIIEDLLIIFKNERNEFEYILSSNIGNDPFYKDLFEGNEKIILDSRRRLSNMLDSDSSINEISKNNIITFYSYKGGVGRSTTLASCATYLSNHFGKKVLIIDCDLEAPGFTNYFLEEPDQVNNHNGFVEYLMDLDFNPNNMELNDYLWEVGKDFSGKGSIYVMPAGNLSDEKHEGNFMINTHKKHYLEGLARIDIASNFNMTSKFSFLLDDLNKKLSPDVILIDSRTGFNDIFGITALSFSSLIIGFFSSNIQTLPGLNYFISKVIESKKGLNAILVNSIITKRSSYNKFEEYVESYIRDNSLSEDYQISLKSYPLSRYTLLETIGTNEESKIDFIDLIVNKRFPDYNEIFDKINELLLNNEVKVEIENSESESLINSEKPTYTREIERKTDELINFDLRRAYENLPKIVVDSYGIQKALKKRIKSKLNKVWPSLYAEHSTAQMKSNIYFRRSMEDVFNKDKFLILGNKGTGKTFLYEALKLPEIVDKIKERAQKKDSFEIFHLIDNKANKFFDTNLFESNYDELFYHKFWVVYIWNAIMLESEKRLSYKSKLEVLPILNNVKTKNRFVEIILNENEFIKIEEDLEYLDFHLKSSIYNTTLIIIFDGLDQIVKPIDWHRKIVPLINFWRNNNFSKISPKLFIRSDLFEKLTNITNIKELKNQAISIEWNQEELFGYFFKIVFTAAKDEFIKYLIFTKLNSYELVKQIKQKAGKDNQLPLEKYYLEPLVRSFFGQFASADNTPRFGESYDWFYRNLKNANNTISLRPFIDLLHNSIEYSNTEDQSQFPILPAYYYVHGEARKTSVSNHFSDLVSEQGNENLKLICDFIREKKSTQIVYLDLTKFEMFNLLSEIINYYSISNVKVEDMIFLLKVNGIIGEKFRSNGLNYSFALLYKYYLGLKSRPNSIK